MTKFLSNSLGIKEPDFSKGLAKLELANGHPSSDIRLTLEVNQLTKDKLSLLGLDPKDTTAKELYMSLLRKIEEDDLKLTKKLRYLAASRVSAEADPVAGMIEVLKEVDENLSCFAIKKSKIKLLLKAVPPKRTMKSLGYRSIDSMLKREPTLVILPAAQILESKTWLKKFAEQYKTLTPSDFEERTISFLEPKNSHWQKINSETLSKRHSNVYSSRETGSILLLSLPGNELPKGAITSSLSLALSELNQIRACSTYLKLSQVRKDFSETVFKISQDQVELKSKLFDQPVPWNLVHRYYSLITEKFRSDVFEPYLRVEDMIWHPVEKTLSDIEPSFKFWLNSSHLGLVEDDQPVSLNLMDSALNLCNQRKFEDRITHYFKNSLWHELLLKYLKIEPVEQSLLSELQPQYELEEINT